MATRAPLVLINGLLQQLPAGDLVRGTGVFPFFTASGAVSNILLTVAGALPFFVASGAASDISLV
jgi:hypothetical protein